MTDLKEQVEEKRKSYTYIMGMGTDLSETLILLFSAIDQQAVELRNRCGECGAILINNCPVCGAPVCCPQCCKIDQQAAEIEELKKFPMRFAEAHKQFWIEETIKEWKEKCAKVAESLSGFTETTGNSTTTTVRKTTAHDIATAIRNLPEGDE